MNYHIKMNFTGDRTEDWKENVWPASIAKRVIKAELGIEPSVENPGGDIRYDTEDPAVFLLLMKIVFTSANGGWWTIDDMPPGINVFYITV